MNWNGADLHINDVIRSIVHVPISHATSARKKIDLDGWLWNSMIASTGQPRKIM